MENQDDGSSTETARSTANLTHGNSTLQPSYSAVGQAVLEPAGISPVTSTVTEDAAEPASFASTIYPATEKPEVSTAPSWGSIDPPAVESAGPGLRAPMDDRPVPVVKVLSVRGIEYAMMSILLWFGAGSLITILVSIIMGGSSFETLAMPLSLLLVTLPGFAYLYLRLRAAELRNPELRLEPSKRRFSQITQILAFLTCLFNLVTVVYILISKVGGGGGGSIGKTIGAAVVTILIAGGILFYYWVDEHKLIERR